MTVTEDQLVGQLEAMGLGEEATALAVGVAVLTRLRGRWRLSEAREALGYPRALSEALEALQGLDVVGVRYSEGREPFLKWVGDL